MLVAERELREATRQRSYRISLLLSIAALAVVIVIANLAGGGDDDPERVVVAGPDAAQRVEPIEQLGTAIGIELEVTTAPDDAAAEAAVIDEDADVAVLADGSRLATREEPEDTSRLGTVVNALRADLALQNGLRDAGLDPQQVADVRATQPPPLDVLRPGDEVDSSRTGVATITNILLFLMLQTYGAWVLTAVTRRRRPAWSKCCWP